MFSRKSESERKLREHDRQLRRARAEADRKAREEEYAKEMAHREELLPMIRKGLAVLFKQQEDLGWPKAGAINRRNPGSFRAEVFLLRKEIHAIQLKSSFYYAEGGTTAHIWMATDGRLYHSNNWGWYIRRSLESMETWMLELLYEELCLSSESVATA